MKRLSSKPTVYLIDGSNFSMRFWEKAGGVSAEQLEKEFVNWLPCRRSGPAGPSITIYYSDSEPADEMLVERGYFMQNEGIRAIIVTSDNGLRDRAAAEGVKTMNCETFLKLAGDELRRESR